jgi:phospholipid/cholesterol/gamma-HCH transport system permease protein
MPAASTSIMLSAFRAVGRRLLSFLRHSGRAMVLLGQTLRATPHIFRNPAITLAQMVEVGIRSLPLVIIVSLFAGATTGWQAKYQLEGLVPLTAIGTAVAKSLILELCPAMTAMVIAGRIGSSIAAELATMRVTEQIDALVTMSIDPVRYLILPRFTAGVVMVPVLVIFSFFVGIFGGYATVVYGGDMSGTLFLDGVRMMFQVRDVTVGLFKAYMFGAIVSFMGCYFGYIADGGAEGVGKASIRSFVSSAVMILIADFLVAIVAFD